MKMVKIKTSQATPIQLAWLTAKLEDWSEKVFVHPDFPYVGGPMGKWDPAQDWRQGGPRLEHIKGFTLKHWLESEPETCCEAHIHNYEGNWVQFGPTPLIAAYRCFVASHLGDEVEVPEILL